MPQSQLIIATLKKLLKMKGLTYQALASSLGISESSVKRIFSEEKFSLKRLEQVCHILEMTVSELFHVMEKENHELRIYPSSKKKKQRQIFVC